MPPKSQRSRACSQCRARRVKCDETPEICNQCRRLGLQCSGPIQGSIVIDMTERLSKPKTKKKKETARASTAARDKVVGRAAAETHPKPVASKSSRKPMTPLDMSLQEYRFPITLGRAEEVEKAMTAIRYHYRPPTFHQPSRALPEALDNAFVTHYITLNDVAKTSEPELQWIGHWGSLFGNATKPVVKISLRAVSMAFYGKYYNDSSITIDSWRWYTVALNAQRSSIARMKKANIPTEEDVAIPMILALYELYAGATATGSAAHLNAADKLIRMRGPINCRSKTIWPFFIAMRTQDAHRSVIFNEISPYSSPDWLEIPFLDIQKDPKQALVSIELIIPHCLAGLGIKGTLRTIFETRIPSNVDVTPSKELACRLIEDLDQWAKEYPDFVEPSVTSDATSTSESSSQSAPESLPRPSTTSAAGALIFSNYMSIGLVLNMLMYKMQTETEAPLVLGEKTSTHYVSEGQKYSEDIIEFVTEIEKAQSPGFDILRSLIPVLTVGCCAPTTELRSTATTMVYGWASKFNGVGSALTRM